MRSIIAISAVTLLAACGSSAPPAPVPEPERQELCRDILNYYECSRLVEQRLLSAAGGGVERRGDTLIIPLAGGTERRLVDRGSGLGGVKLTYNGYMDRIGYHLVNVYFYEGGAFLLIRDKGAEEIRVDAPPVVSPDGRRLVVASSGGTASYSPNLLQVWRVTPDGLRIEWELEPDDWGAEDPRWVDPGTVRFVRTSSCTLLDGCEAEATLRRVEGEWRVDTAAVREPSAVQKAVRSPAASPARPPGWVGS